MKEHYGVTKDGQEISAYTLNGSRGMKAVVLDYGAILDKVFVPDASGNIVDVTLSSPDYESYKADTNFFG